MTGADQQGMVVFERGMKTFKKQRLWFFLAASTLMVCVSGCSRGIHSGAIGKWRAAGNDGQTIEFRSDGTFQGIDQYGRALSGNFGFTDPEHVKLDITVSSEDKTKGLRFVDHSTGIVKLAVNDNELVMTEPGGSAIRYQRQR